MQARSVLRYSRHPHLTLVVSHSRSTVPWAHTGFHIRARLERIGSRVIEVPPIRPPWRVANPW